MADDETQTLTDRDIEDARPVDRRGALGILGASLVGGAVVATGFVARPGTAHAKQTDSDSGSNADAAGRGRTGHTDRDSGGGSDAAGHGVCARRGHTDSDSGGNADAAGRGRGPCR